MPKLAHLKYNDLAPEAEILDAHGHPVRLSTLWAGRPLVLAFTRHFGCPQCKQLLDMLAHFAPELSARGLGLAVVTQGQPDSTRDFCAQYAPGITCLSDPQRDSYRAFGLERASIWQTFLSINVWRSNRRLGRERGWQTEMPPAGQDAMQLAGVFIIGPDGRIRLPYYYEDIADHPPVEIMLRGVMGVNWGQPLEGPIAPDA